MRKDGKRGSDTTMVATQSRFHRDMPDGEQIALKPLSFLSLTELTVCDTNLRFEAVIAFNRAMLQNNDNGHHLQAAVHGQLTDFHSN